MTLRRRLIAVTLVLASMALADAGRAQTPVHRALRVNGDVGVNVWIPDGSIRVIGWDRDSLVVEGTVTKGDRLFFGGGVSGVKLGLDDAIPGAAPAPRASPCASRAVHASTSVRRVPRWRSAMSPAGSTPSVATSG